MTTTRSSTLAVLVQIVAGTVVLGACYLLFANWAYATIAFFGETATVEPYNVRAYLLWLGLGAASLAVLLIAGHVRRGGWVAPVLLGIVFGMSAVLFHVALPDTDPAPASPSGNPNACYSGSNDCPGG